MLVTAGAIAVIAAAASVAQASAQPGAYTTRGAWAFTSAPNLHPPKLRTDAPTLTSKLAPGYFLTANFPNVATGGALRGQGGPLILDSKLQPVWFKPTPTSAVAVDLKQQTFEGKPALSWWEGVVSSTGATASGSVFVVDQHYRQVARLTGDLKDGWVISPHEVVITGHDAWVTSYKTLPGVDLSAYGGSSSGTLYDFAVQEYDLRTGKLLKSWDAFNPGGTPNVPLSESKTAAPASAAVPWDAYHGNSIQLVGSHEFLVSMRDTWAGYLVDINTGKVVWTLGGNASSFSVPARAQFQWQHMMEMLPNHEVSVYDDHCCGLVGPGKFAPPTGPSRGLVLKLDTVTHAASLVAQYRHTPTLDSAFTGSMQLLSNGNALVGWGSQPYFSEYSKTGKLLLDAAWPGVDQSYRVLLTNNWVGQPYFPPSGAARKSGGRTTVYASWDGATEVASWRVLAGSSANRLTVAATAPKTGFETAIGLKRGYRAYKVSALNAKGRVIGRSGVFPKKKTAPSLPGSY
jgi:hypothetical protein